MVQVKAIGFKYFMRDPVAFCQVEEELDEEEDDELVGSNGKFVNVGKTAQHRTDSDEHLTSVLIRVLNRDIPMVIDNFSKRNDAFTLRMALLQRQVGLERDHCLVLQIEREHTRWDLYKIPVFDMNCDLDKYQRLNRVLLGDCENKIESFCVCDGVHSVFQVVRRAGLNASINCESNDIVYGLYCKHENCRRIVYVDVATSNLGERIERHISGDFSKCHLTEHHKVAKEEVRTFFYEHIIVVVLQVSDDAHTRRNWEVFWQSLLRTHVCFADVQTPGCNKR